MHTHGTAVLDRPAEAAVPAQALPSALGVVPSTLDLEPARSTDDAAKALAPGYDDVRGLSYAELAVTLNASGVHPKHLRSADTAQLMEWAAQGLALLGIDRVRWYAHRTCLINAQPLHCISTESLAEFTRMWPRPKAFQPCHDAAWRLMFAAPASHTTTVPASHTALRAPLSAPLSRSGL